MRQIENEIAMNTVERFTAAYEGTPADRVRVHDRF
jgi:hypothetical protein